MRVYQRSFFPFPSVLLQSALVWAFFFFSSHTLLNFQESALKQFLELKKWARERMIMFLKEKIRWSW